MTLIVGLDTETTGLEQTDGHRIIEIAMCTYELETRRHVDTLVQRIDPQRSVPNDVIAIHGITYEDVSGCPIWEDVVPEIVARLEKSALTIAHNAAFDMPFIGLELIRIGMKIPSVPSFCTMEDARWACPDGKLPRLGELCFALGVDYDPSKAHGAEYDVCVMMECFFKGLDRGFYKLPSGILLKEAA
jgi:DNA polymerase-3 subunit epsilon